MTDQPGVGGDERSEATLIKYPKGPTEFEIQSYLYQQLLRLGYNVRGEVSSNRSRFDLVVFRGGKEPIQIIEVKKSRPGRTGGFGRGGRLRKAIQCRQDKERVDKQLEKYKKTGVPLKLICGMAKAKRYIEAVKGGGVEGYFVHVSHSPPIGQNG